MSILSRDHRISWRRPETLSGFCAASLAGLAAFGVASVAALGVTLPGNRGAAPAPVAPPAITAVDAPKAASVPNPALTDVSTLPAPQSPILAPSVLAPPVLAPSAAAPSADDAAAATADEPDAAASKSARSHGTHHHARSAARIVPVRAEVSSKVGRPANRHPAHTAGHIAPATRATPPEAVVPARVHDVYAAAPPS